MTLEKLLAKNKIILPGKVLTLCCEGISLMEKSIDPLHDKGHIERIFSNLDCFLGEKQIEKPKINFQILILSICWHDVWKSKRFPSSLPKLLYQRFMDGIGSSKIFSQKAKKAGLEQRLIDSVCYSIRKHADIQFLPYKTLEAKILKDIDILDGWSLEKLKGLEKIFLIPGKINIHLLKLGRFYFNHFMAKRTDAVIYFSGSRAEFRRRKKVYLEEVDRLIKKYKYSLK